MIQLSFRVQKLYEAQFIFETRGCFNMKTPNCLMHAHSHRHWEMKGRRGWAQWPLTAKVSLSVEWQGRRRGQWMSMREGEITKCSLVRSSLFLCRLRETVRVIDCPSHKLFSALNEVLPRWWSPHETEDRVLFASSYLWISCTNSQVANSVGTESACNAARWLTSCLTGSSRRTLTIKY